MDNHWLISSMHGIPSEQDKVVLKSSIDAARTWRPSIRIFVRTYEAAFNSHDAAKLSSLYGPEADIMIRNEPRIQGAQAIRQWWETYFASPRPYRAIFIVNEINMITPDVALLDLAATGASQGSEARLMPTRSAQAIWIVSRRSGRWRIEAIRVMPGPDDEIVRGP